MRKVALDTETHLIKPGMLFPKLVCVSTYDGFIRKLFLAQDGLAEFIRLLKDPDIQIIGHNIAYDIGVLVAEAVEAGLDILPLVFQAYEADRIADTMVRAMLVAIAQGKFQEIEGQRRGKQFGLDMLALNWLHKKLNKKDTWRLHYAALENIPLAVWPPEAREYAELDAEITWRVNEAITSWIIAEGNSSGVMPDEYRQVRAAWILQLMAGWGVRIDEKLVDIVKENLEAQRKASYEAMDTWGIFKKAKDGSFKLTEKGARQKNLARLRELIEDGYRQQGEKAPRTEKGAIKTGADEARESGNIGAIAYADGASAEKLLNTYIPILYRGKNGTPVTSSPNVLVGSGRTSWANPNWQNPPRAGMIRECVIARSGFLLCGADLDTVELRALAQTCLELFGYSEMAAALMRGEDLHLSLAAEILGMDYAQAKILYDQGDLLVTGARQIAKIVNFGLPGGMGAKKFAIAQIAAGQPLIKDPAAPLSDHIKRAYQLKETWFKRWPEMRQFLRNAGEVVGDFGPKMIEHPWSGRLRGGLDYCSCANSYFQGRVADGTKLALWRVAKACYVDKTSDLYGCRLVLFLHDELILEVPEGRADACGAELVKILCSAVQEVIPDIPITSSAVVTRRWFKGAKPVKINGKLVPSKPLKDKNSDKTTWVHDQDGLLAA